MGTLCPLRTMPAEMLPALPSHMRRGTCTLLGPCPPHPAKPCAEEILVLHQRLEKRVEGSRRRPGWGAFFEGHEDALELAPGSGCISYG